MKIIYSSLSYFLLIFIACLFSSCDKTGNKLPEKPNIIILFSDDAGYADFGFTGNEKIKTPNIDQLAQNGIQFTNGYVSGPCCSPTRAGLMTGRYQQRFGHETNPGGHGITYSKTDPDLVGLPVAEKTIADLLKAEGYKTGIVGKWHLGERPQFHPCNRGFDEFFGFLRGSSKYMPELPKEIVHNFDTVDCETLPYLTDAFGDKACEFIKSNRNDPFFLYLSFNAVHTPMQARSDYLEQERGRFETEGRALNSAMTRSLDDNIGKVISLVKELGLEEKTLIFFLNDNGGAMPYNSSCNDPFAGTKGTFLDGGIHVPFVVQWKGVLAEGVKYEKPVISLDILPTAVALAGGQFDKDILFDGVNLMPYLSGENKGDPHYKLFWRLIHHGAVRKGDWKLIWFDDKPPRLHNLKEDIKEQNDLSQKYPEKTKELLQDYYKWEKGTVDPLWYSDPIWKKHDRMRYDQDYVETLRRK